MKKKAKNDQQQKLDFPVMTRINQAKFDELTRLAGLTKDETVSGIIRDLIHSRPVKVYTHDETLDLLMEELAALRAEIKAIGVNINQITRRFNTYPDARRKEFYAKTAFAQYTAIESKIDRLLEIIAQLAKKWLSA